MTDNAEPKPPANDEAATDTKKPEPFNWGAGPGWGAGTWTKPLDREAGSK